MFEHLLVKYIWYKYIRIFVLVEIFTNVTLWAGNSGESGSIGESGASEVYDDSGDSFKFGVLVIPRILANLIDLVILVILMN